MKRILVLNYEFPPLGGGASPVSYEIAERLSKTGEYEIDVVTMGYKGLPHYEEINPRFRIHRVRCLRSKKEICHPWEQLTYLVTGYFKAASLIRAQAYDVCHCHFIIPTGVVARLLKKNFSLPYVITAHGSDVLGYNARFKKLYPFLVGSWKRILAEAREIISPSRFLKQEILKVYPDLGEERISVIPNGFDSSRFSPKDKKNWIFSSGRLFPNKGFQYLIQAVSAQDIGYEVHVAGDGPMMQTLKELAANSKTKIVFHGWLNNKDQVYRELLEHSAIYVLASEKENASISLLEAMAAGCAVITTNSSGCAETVGEAGLLFESKNVAELTTQLERLIQGPALLASSQHALKERVEQVFSWDQILEQYRKSLCP